MNSVLAARAISNLLTDRPTTMMTGQVKTKLWVGNRRRFRCPVGKEREERGKEREGTKRRRPICPLRAHSLGRSIHPATATDRVRERVHFRGRESEHCVLPASSVSGEFCPAHSGSAIDAPSQSFGRLLWLGWDGMTILGRARSIARSTRSIFLYMGQKL